MRPYQAVAPERVAKRQASAEGIGKQRCSQAGRECRGDARQVTFCSLSEVLACTVAPAPAPAPMQARWQTHNNQQLSTPPHSIIWAALPMAPSPPKAQPHHQFRPSPHLVFRAKWLGPSTSTTTTTRPCPPSRPPPPCSPSVPDPSLHPPRSDPRLPRFQITTSALSGSPGSCAEAATPQPADCSTSTTCCSEREDWRSLLRQDSQAAGSS